MTILYQFPISHYCEKARWAFDYKGVPYTTKNLLVGPHIRKMKSLAPTPLVPVIRNKEGIIQGSDKIIDYLDEKVGERPLTPRATELNNASREWESYAAKHIGDPLRCVMYDTLLLYPERLIPLFCMKGPWYGGMLYRLIYTRLERKIRHGLMINDRTVKISGRLLEKGMARLSNQISRSDYLAGDAFSRADLTVCSLLAPIVGPEKSDYRPMIKDLPEALLEYREKLVGEDVMMWVNKVYKKYRGVTSGEEIKLN